ncbi:hypothetical protein [Oleiagrimonas sp. MCCC 1A03011]|uniref:hypothetical protein n=1 Tax=Oleiagrimonas sp. MCCC 1A03011 TaxID=1926883 RepID=UPI000DC2A1EB|nr:hypothetical protein [Oleiagrimonas sp. MCCC 1A03011]RAP55630.1 hypothetical protein BTJ49_15250 [Oleiagrimonas sp. MCCC 1A03011]
MARLIRVLLVWAALIFILYAIRITLFHDAQQQQVSVIFKPAAMLLSSAALLAFGLIAINDVRQGFVIVPWVRFIVTYKVKEPWLFSFMTLLYLSMLAVGIVYLISHAFE